MYFQFGSYRHSENEVDLTNFTIHRMHSPRNQMFFQRHTLVLMGHFCVSGQDEITDAIIEMEEAYGVRPGGDNVPTWTRNAGLYTDEEKKTAHFLDASDSINGVRVISITYSKNDGGEYATGRSYSIVLQADYLNAHSQIYQFEETVQLNGICTHRWEWIPTWVGLPIRFINFARTTQTITQTGSATGVLAWPFGPIPVLDTAVEHQDLRIVERGSAQMIGVNQTLLYPMRWRFVYETPWDTAALPHVDFNRFWGG